MKRSWLALPALAVAAVLMFASASSAVVGTDLDEGMELSVFTITGNSTQGGHIDAWVNEMPDGDDYSQIGGIPLISGAAEGCEYDSADPFACYQTFIGYCSEADVDLVLDPMPFSQVDVDGRVQYLTWKHDYEWWNQNWQAGLASAPMAATQALVWAWHSDPETGSTVFSSVAGGLDDPLNWDGLTPSAHTDTSPRVGFHSDVDLDDPYWTGTDAELLQAATQAVYDLAVEATAKAGPWTLEQGVGATGVVLTGSNGPIQGETVNFKDGTANGVDVTTDANGFAAWPAGGTVAVIEGPGETWRTPGPDGGGQDVILTIGEELTVNANDPAPTTTTTTTTTTTAAPTTTTTIVVESPNPEMPESDPADPIVDSPSFTG
ncbi:MAG: hypothetical protein P8I99_15590 [Acidimicrobiales bacterium]|nr:hypothetical protein [Acidimicrobiales bacterium]